jgi:hypothetical protein
MSRSWVSTQALPIGSSKSSTGTSWPSPHIASQNLVEIQEHGDICDMIGIHLGWKKTQLKRFKLGRPMRSQHPFVPSSSQLEIVIRIIDYYPTIIPFLHPLNLKIQYRTPKMVIGKLFFMVIHHGHFGVPPEFTGWMKNDLKSHLGRLHRLAV